MRGCTWCRRPRLAARQRRGLRRPRLRATAGRERPGCARTGAAADDARCSSSSRGCSPPRRRPRAIQTLYDLIAGVNAGTLVERGERAGRAGDHHRLAARRHRRFRRHARRCLSRRLQAARPLRLRCARWRRSPRRPAQRAAVVAWGAVPADEPTAESMAAAALGALKAKYDERRVAGGRPDDHRSRSASVARRRCRRI